MNIIKIKAFIGLTATISTAPMKPPINAPTIGINAVTAVNAPIGPAYGMFNISIPIAQSEPSITASFAWPVIKFLKESLANLHIFIIESAFSSSILAYINFFD